MTYKHVIIPCGWVLWHGEVVSLDDPRVAHLQHIFDAWRDALEASFRQTTEANK